MRYALIVHFSHQVHLYFLSLCVLLTNCNTFAVQKPDPHHVVVVANIDSPESLELANFYIQKRAIPPQNLIVIKTDVTETISRETYVRDILNPLRSQLIEKQFIDGFFNPEKKDYHNRSDFFCYDVHFKYLVLCKGIPLKIQNSLIPEPDIPNHIQDIFRTTRASVDSELTQLTAQNKPNISWTSNPLFQIKNPTHFDFTNAISVCRIDGPSINDAKQIILDSIEAERSRFLKGRAYIDLHAHHKDGNIWLKQSATLLREYGYDVDTIPNAPHWSFADRHDAPCIYLGWYQSHAAGPMLEPNPIPIGSIGAHIHSYSAGSIATASKYWVGPLIHSGYAVTFGNVYEPYLQLTMRPDRFIEHLLRGYCVGDASLYALTTLSWQNVTIGDPLYQPFCPAEEIDPVSIIRDPDSDPYQRILALNRIAKTNLERAVDLAFDSHVISPNLPVAFKILLEYQSQSSPILIHLLYDYIISNGTIKEPMVPLYLICFDQLIQKDETIRAERIKKMLIDASKNWNQATKDLLPWPEQMN